MARDDRRDAPHNGVHGAHKSYKERKGTKYIHSDPASPPDVPGLLHTTSLGRTGCGALLVSPRGRFILGGAFRLYVLRDKSAVRAGTAFHKGLRLAHKRVRQRIAANVSNRKGLSFPIQHEINAPGKVTDTSLLHGTGDAHALRSRRTSASERTSWNREIPIPSVDGLNRNGLPSSKTTGQPKFIERISCTTPGGTSVTKITRRGLRERRIREATEGRCSVSKIPGSRAADPVRPSDATCCSTGHSKRCVRKNPAA